MSIKVDDKSLLGRMAGIVDDISTGFDMIKPEMQHFEKYVAEKIKKASELVWSDDGHTFVHVDYPDSIELTLSINRERLAEVVDMLNDYFGLVFTPEQIKEAIADDVELIVEIARNTYTDTEQRSDIADLMCKKHCGMVYPMNGDSDHHKERFARKMLKTGFVDTDWENHWGL